MTLALFALHLAAPEAQADPIRTMQGRRVETEDYVVVPFSMDDHDSVHVLKALSGQSRVLAVSLDGAGERSQLPAFLRSQGIELTVACDPEDSLQLGAPAEREDTLELLLAAQALSGGERALAAAD